MAEIVSSVVNGNHIGAERGPTPASRGIRDIWLVSMGAEGTNEGIIKCRETLISAEGINRCRGQAQAVATAPNGDV